MQYCWHQLENGSGSGFPPPGCCWANALNVKIPSVTRPTNAKPMSVATSVRPAVLGRALRCTANDLRKPEKNIINVKLVTYAILQLSFRKCNWKIQLQMVFKREEWFFIAKTQRTRRLFFLNEITRLHGLRGNQSSWENNSWNLRNLGMGNGNGVRQFIALWECMRQDLPPCTLCIFSDRHRCSFICKTLDFFSSLSRPIFAIFILQ